MKSLDCKVNAAFQGKYHLRLIGPDGKIKQDVIGYNTICVNMFNIIANWAGSIYTMHYYITHLELGSGTTTPTTADTSLTSLLWSVATTAGVIKTASATESSLTISATVPASSSYVGTITEVGLAYSKYDGTTGNTYLLTHSLLKDSEGQIISINKTLNDTLIVDITLTCSLSLSAPFKFYSQVDATFDDITISNNGIASCNTLAQQLLNCAASNAYITNFALSICNESLIYAYGDTFDFTNAGDLVPTKNTGTLSLTYSGTARLLATEANTNYFKLLRIKFRRYYYSNSWNSNLYTMALCELTDSDVLTPYEMSNISVGIGDGATTAFECPLNYFMNNTETVYVNSVAKTRGSDYTIDSNNNHDAMLSLMDYTNVKCTGVTVPQSTTSAFNYTYLQMAHSHLDKTYLPYFEAGHFCYGADNVTPMVIDFGEAKEFNRLAGTFYHYNTTKVLISYSTDGTTYNDLQEVTITSPHVDNYATQDLSLTFDTVTARYWKFTLTPYSTNATYLVRTSMSFDVDTFFLSKVTTNSLVFTTPPANGDVITMKATLDRLLKNSNWALDVALNMTLSFV